MAEFRMRKINNLSELKTKKVGGCIECDEPVNDCGMPFVHDLRTNTIKTVAKMVYETTEDFVCGGGHVARPTCGNMACINPKHIEYIKA